jgi:hypothetical protein
MKLFSIFRASMLFKYTSKSLMQAHAQKQAAVVSGKFTIVRFNVIGPLYSLRLRCGKVLVARSLLSN